MSEPEVIQGVAIDPANDCGEYGLITDVGDYWRLDSSTLLAGKRYRITVEQLT